MAKLAVRKGYVVQIPHLAPNNNILYVEHSVISGYICNSLHLHVDVLLKLILGVWLPVDMCEKWG